MTLWWRTRRAADQVLSRNQPADIPYDFPRVSSAEACWLSGPEQTAPTVAAAGGRAWTASKGTSSVRGINLWSGQGIQGLKGTLPPAAAFAGLAGVTDVGISDQPGITGTLSADSSRATQLRDIRLN